MKKLLIMLVAVGIGLPAFGVPASYDVAISFAPPLTGGPVESYHVYDNCNLVLQTVGTDLGAITSGGVINLSGDTDSPPVICVRGQNTDMSTGTPVVQFGGFTNTLTLTAQLDPPGDTTVTATCNLNLTTGTGTCTVQ